MEVLQLQHFNVLQLQCRRRAILLYVGSGIKKSLTFQDQEEDSKVLGSRISILLDVGSRIKKINWFLDQEDP